MPPELLHFRAEFANQVLQSLRFLAESSWQEVEARRQDRADYFEMAFDLLQAAAALMVEEHGPDSQRPLTALVGDADVLFGSAPVTDAFAAPDIRVGTARALLSAAYFRDAPGFGQGAYREIMSLLEGIVNVDALAGVALRAISADASDLSSRGPIRALQVAPPERDRNAG